MRRRWIFGLTLLGILPLTAVFGTAADVVRILVWDEQQPEQKQGYGDKFLGETIAEALKTRPDLQVRTAALKDPQQGLSAEQLDQTDVLIVWSHIRVRDQDDALIEGVVRRVQAGRLSLIALHSAHWHKAFVRLMQERAKADAEAALPEQLRGRVQWQLLNESPYGKAVTIETPLTPAVRTGDNGQRQLVLPQCVFPFWRPDGAASHVTTLLPDHPIAAGLPRNWDVAHTEMYGEPHHIPEPDQVIFEERWDKGEYFRSGCLWQIGKGRVFYFRPGHEIFPVYQQKEPLQVLENASRWLAAQQVE